MNYLRQLEHSESSRLSVTSPPIAI